MGVLGPWPRSSRVKSTAPALSRMRKNGLLGGYIVKYGFSTSLTPGRDKHYTFYYDLTIRSDTSEPQARVAQKVPSPLEGDWKVES